MNSILLDHRIHKFIKMKENEIPEIKNVSIDIMIDKLVQEDRLVRDY